MAIDTRFPLYDILFYNHDGDKILLLDVYEYLEFSQRISDSWNHQIRVAAAPDDTVKTEFFRDTLKRDFIIEVYRTDALTGDRELVYEGFNRTLVDQMKQDGSLVFTLYGVGYTHLLKRRIIVPAAGSETSDQSGVASTAMLAYVDEQAINPVDAVRVITGLSNIADPVIGDNAAYSARYTNLFTALSRLSEQGGLDFGVVKGASVGTFIFTIRDEWGIDRSYGNAAGNAPTIFDVTLNNMLIPILSRNGGDEINMVYVGGQGQGEDRTILEVKNPTAISVSPWNRQEEFVDARSESTTDGLTTRGEAYLSEHEYKEKLTFNTEETVGTRWLRDWELGDTITARYGGLSFNKKIIKVGVVVSAGGTGQARIEVISAELEDV